MSRKTLRILQYNVRKGRVRVMVPLLENEEVQNMDILAIQEPWHNTQNQSSYNPSSSPFHLIYKGRKARGYVST